MKPNKARIGSLLALALAFSIVAPPAGATQKGANGEVAVSIFTASEDTYVEFFAPTGAYTRATREWSQSLVQGLSYQPGQLGQDIYFYVEGAWTGARAHRYSTVPGGPVSRLPYTFIGFEIAPDGERVAMYDGDLVVANRSGNFRRVLVSQKDLKGFVENVSWSPDGRYLAFSSAGKIYKVNVVSRKVTDLGAGYDVDWSPDGSKLAFAYGSVYTMDSSGGEREAVASGSLPVWSPDGQRILFVRRHEGFVERYYTVAPDGTDEKRWGTHAESDYEDPMDIAWQTVCTITGGDEGGELLGTDGDDFICGGSGADTIYGGGGNDTIYGGGGHDKLYGESGNDILNGQEGRDLSVGGEGNDLLTDVHGADVLKAGLGEDHVYTKDKGADAVYAGQGNDVCWVNGSKDTKTSC